MADRTVFDIFDYFSEDGHFVLSDEWGRRDEQVEKLCELFPRTTIEKGGVLKKHRRFYVCKVGEFFQREEKYLFSSFWLDDFDSTLSYAVRKDGYEYTGKHIEDSNLVVVFGWNGSGNGRFGVTCGIVDPTVDLMNTCIALEPLSGDIVKKSPEGYYHLFRVVNGVNSQSNSIEHIEYWLNSAFHEVRWMFNNSERTILEDNLESIIRRGGDIKKYFPSMCGEKKH